MAPQPQISYSAPAVFLSSDNWLQIRNALTQLSPLQELVWTSSFRPATRTIHELHVDFISLDEVKEDSSSPHPPCILARPLVNIFVVSCDDAEVYKNSVKKQIKDWHTQVSQKKHQEWLILLVVRSDARASSSFLKMKTNILDKIKADFNTDKRERCIQVNWSPGNDTAGAWDEVHQKMSEGLLVAFDAGVSQREEEVRRSESQRQMPGWNFCKFFLLKESLALSFEGMGLFDDGLLQYEELEAAFFQVTKEKNLSWFGRLINPDPRDDSMPILDLSKKPYRDLIISNSITVFDIRVYLLAIQCEILGRQLLCVEIIRKVESVVASVARILEAVEDQLPRGFIPSWCFSAAMTTIDHCDALVGQGEPDPLLVSAKAELLEISLSQLNRLAIQCHYLPAQPPFLPNGHPRDMAHSSPKASLSGISNQVLLEALKSQEGFQEFYGRLTERAIDLYVKGGRRKFAVKLHGQRASISRLRGDHTTAQRSFRSLQAHYGPTKWSAMEVFVTGQYIESFWEASSSKDQEWAEFALNFMHSLARCSADDQQSVIRSTKNGERFFDILSEVQGVLATTGDEIRTTDHPIFQINLDTSSIALCREGRGSTIDATVINRWPTPFHVESIVAVAKGFKEVEIAYSTENVELSTGSSVVRLRCSNPVAGTFIHIRSSLVMGRVTFEYPQVRWPPASESWSPALPSYSPLIFTVPKSYDSLDVEITQDTRIKVGQRNSLLFTIYSGRETPDTLEISVRSIDGIFLYPSESKLVPGETTAKLEHQGGALRLAGSTQKRIQFIIPFYSPSRTSLPIDVSITYNSPGRITPSTVLFHQVVDVALPLSVNARNVFRSQSLFSLYQVTSNLSQPITIRGAKLSLEKPDSDIIMSRVSNHNAPLIATATDSVNFIFELHSKASRTSSCPLHLEIEFQTRLEEVKQLVSHHVKAIMAKDQFRSARLHEREFLDLVMEALSSDDSWISGYEFRRSIHTPNTLQLEGIKGECLKEILQAITNPSPIEFVWRSLTIPLELPFMNIVLEASLELQTTDSQDSASGPNCMFAGQPCPVDIVITSTFHWGLEIGGRNETYPMTFQVQEAKHDWLLSGRTRGEFHAKDGGTFRQAMTLIPLHHGKLALPVVEVHPIVEGGTLQPPSSECSQANGARRITVVPRGGRSTFVVNLGEE